MINYRLIQLLIAVIGALMVLIAWLYFQRHLGLMPCPMCINQRLFVIMAAGFALLSLLPSSAMGRGVCSVLTSAAILGGGLVAARQVWLQSLPPDQAPSCGPSFSFVVDTFPFSDMLKALFLGDGSCAEVKWQWLGLSIPSWTLISFIALLLLALWGLYLALVVDKR